VREVTIERWIARPPGVEPVEVATKQEAVRLARSSAARGSTAAAVPTGWFPPVTSGPGA
jgi:hypothetical protein